MQWYFSQDKVQHGPVEQQELMEKIAAGEVSQDDLVWHEGADNWLPVRQVNALHPVAPPPPAPDRPQTPAASPAEPAPTPADAAAPATNDLAAAGLRLGGALLTLVLGLAACAALLWHGIGAWLAIAVGLAAVGLASRCTSRTPGHGAPPALALTLAKVGSLAGWVGLLGGAALAVLRFKGILH